MEIPVNSAKRTNANSSKGSCGRRKDEGEGGMGLWPIKGEIRRKDVGLSDDTEREGVHSSLSI
jgi:hypothetical protein